MEINRKLLELNKKIYFEEDIDFSHETLDPVLIRKIKDTHVVVEAIDYEDILMVTINLKANVVLPCSYTLEDVDYVIKGQEDYIFTDDEERIDEDDYSTFYEPNDIIDLNPYIFSIIIALIPFKVVKKGAKLPSGGKDYRVISEEDYYKERANRTDSRWSKLDEIEFDENEEK